MEGTLFLLAVVCFVAMVSPGPDFILVTRSALLYPRAQALATALGIVSGCLVHATYCILGLAWVITQSIVIFSIIKYLGAVYLIYIGVKALLSKPTDRGTEISQGASIPSLREAFVQGFLCNVLNPKLAVFLLSLFTQFIDANASLHDKMLVAGIFVGESAVYWPFMVLLLQSGPIRQIFTNLRVILDRVCGALLVYLGIRVAIQSE